MGWKDGLRWISYTWLGFNAPQALSWQKKTEKNVNLWGFGSLWGRKNVITSLFMQAEKLGITIRSVTQQTRPTGTGGGATLLHLTQLFPLYPNNKGNDWILCLMEKSMPFFSWKCFLRLSCVHSTVELWKINRSGAKGLGGAQKPDKIHMRSDH